jgi:hypothetical protein
VPDGLLNGHDIAVHGADVWIVDAAVPARLLRYAAAGRTSGNAGPSGSFVLHPDNVSPTGVVTDGLTLWVTDDVRDEVFVYTMAGGLVGRWVLDPRNQAASGVTRDPTGASQDLWVVDREDAWVYRYAGASGVRLGALAATDLFLLSPLNSRPEGIADPPTAVSAVSPAAGAKAPAVPTALVTDAARASVTPPAARAITFVIVNGPPAEVLAASGPTVMAAAVIPSAAAAVAARSNSATGSAVTGGRRGAANSPLPPTDQLPAEWQAPVSPAVAPVADAQDRDEAVDPGWLDAAPRHRASGVGLAAPAWLEEFTERDAAPGQSEEQCPTQASALALALALVGLWGTRSDEGESRKRRPLSERDCSAGGKPRR